MIDEYYSKDHSVLTLPVRFNDSLEYIVFHPDLKKIIFGYYYDMSLDNVIFPEKLESIRINACFNQSLLNVIFPENFKFLEFPYHYSTIINSTPLTLDTLPDTISKIIFSGISVPINNLPPTIKEIIIIWPKINDLIFLKIPFGCKITNGYNGKENIHNKLIKNKELL